MDSFKEPGELGMRFNDGDNFQRVWKELHGYIIYINDIVFTDIYNVN